MRTIELTYPHSLRLEELPNTIAAIGFFDGIHVGHQKVIQTATKRAKEKNIENAVITFHPHPSVVLKQATQHVKYITPMHEKQEMLQQLNVDRLYIITFNKELSSLSPQQFIDHFIIGLNISHLVAGFDFSFGYKGHGDMGNLKDLTRDAFTYTAIDKVELDDEKISSTQIRKLLSDGEINRVNSLLGRPLTVTGIVIEGDKRGRTIGYPTANLQINPDALLPKSGVYAVKVHFKSEVYEGMANLGVKPTFLSNVIEPSVEVNLFNYNNNLYGEQLIVEWHKFIRDEEKFNGVDALVNQIANDEQVIRKYFQHK